MVGVRFTPRPRLSLQTSGFNRARESSASKKQQIISLSKVIWLTTLNQSVVQRRLAFCHFFKLIFHLVCPPLCALVFQQNLFPSLSQIFHMCSCVFAGERYDFWFWFGICRIMKEEKEEEGESEGEHPLINWINNGPSSLLYSCREKMNMEFKVHVKTFTASNCIFMHCLDQSLFYHVAGRHKNDAVLNLAGLQRHLMFDGTKWTSYMCE